MYKLYILLILIGIVYSQIKQYKNAKQQLRQKLIASWAKFGKREFSNEQLEYISYYFKNIQCDHFIDDITWQDLDMNMIFKQIDTSNSSVGQEYLYRLLRTPEYNKNELNKRDKLIDSILSNEEQRLKLQTLFANLGFCKRFSAYCYIDLLKDTIRYSNWHHYFLLMLLPVSIVILLFFNSGIGVLFFSISLAVLVADYYRFKGKIENFYSCVKYIARMSECCQKIANLKIEYVDNEKMKKYGDLFSKERKKLSIIISGTNYTGSITDMLMDYVRMITHIDIIMYNQIISSFQKRQTEIIEMFETLGYLEALISIASYRECFENWCKPDFDSCKKGLQAVDLYHPLIENAISNSIKTKDCILLTGSNASGKSTFLRTVAINAIFAQTIYTCMAKEYQTPFYRIYSSMSLNDNLLNGESYFMVEIKALKRILDQAENENIPVLCFVDEVLRGTNTVERIAASSKILEYLQNKGTMCFAATHDIELTKLLENYYINYHFEEDVSSNDVTFNYRLQNGPAVTRNAIKLLKMMAYDNDIVENAENRAKQFLESGNWN